MTEEPPSPEEAVVASPGAVGEGDPHVDDNAINIEPAAVDPNVAVTRPKLTLSFENLTVHVPGERGSCCNCLQNPIKNFLQEYVGMSLEERNPFYALNDVSGVVSSGEMCLILGVNETSKSTLLRALSGRLNEHDELQGTIALNGMPLSVQNAQGWRRLTPYVSASDSSHCPVLTVRETLSFAADCVSADGQTAHRVDRVLELLGLDHVGDTVVGDENLRGVSGGQKRRVTVGEMMMDTQNTAFFCFENITDGLASTDSLSLISHLKRACKGLNLGGIVSLSQPSDEIVELFDKVLVLGANGDMSYFGSIDRRVLKDIFLDSDNEDTPGSLSDLVLGKSLTDADGRVSKEEEVRLKFRETPFFQDIATQLISIRNNYKPGDNLADLLPPTKYSTSGWHQFQVICRRRLKLIARNAVTYTRVGIAILFGIIIGSLFGDLNQDIVGSLSRTGYLFLNSFLVLMLSSAVVLPEGFRQRTTLFKHRSAEFFSGRIAYLAQVLMDIPLAVLEALILASISYFWVDMNPGVANFFYFAGSLIGLEFVGQAFGRLLCATFRKQVSANAMSTVVIIGWGTVAGFMPTYGGIPWILRWLSWVTPVSYAFEGMMLNEFAGRELFAFVGGGPDGVAIGSLTGDDWLSIFSLPRVDWGAYADIKALNLCMLFILAIVADLFGLYYVEVTRSWYHNQTRRPQSCVKSLEMTASQGLESLPSPTGASKALAPTNTQGHDSWPMVLAVRDLCYHVPGTQKSRLTCKSLMGPFLVRLSGASTEEVSSGMSELTLLNSVNARFTRSRMCALMGSSGAGKTTLLDVIAGYKTGGRITGDIIIDGQPKQASLWKKISGYAEQNDILNPYLSTLETLRFTANCRLSREVKRDEIISRVVDLMDLKQWLDMVVGRELEGEGLPKHARKRLTIAIQLVVQPRILFLDEPTTGLDSNAAALVVQAIRRATDALGLITLATIHQPSNLIWDAFDDLLLLSKGGRVAYMGEMGLKSQTVLSHFSTLGKRQAPESCNPADFVLMALTSADPDEAVAAFEGTTQHEELTIAVENDLKGNATAVPQHEIHTSKPNSSLIEIMLLSKRHLITQWRNPSYSFMRLICSVLVSFYMGVVFYGDKGTITGAIFSIGSIFFVVFVLVIPMAAAVVPLIDDRAVLYRETVSGTYTRLAYGMGSLIADVPFHLLNGMLMFVFFYFVVGFRLEGPIMGYFILMIVLANWVIMSMGQLFALVSPNEESAHGLAGLSVILSVILMGFLITVTAMPAGWVWAYWANLFRYILQGLVTNELAGNTYTIDLDLSGFFPERSTNFTNLTNLVLFAPGADGFSNASRGAATLVSLIGAAGNGTNSQSAVGDVRTLVSCIVDNECMQNPPLSTMLCFTGFRPPCKDAFDAAVASLPLSMITECFAPSFGGNATIGSGNTIDGTPSDFSTAAFEEMGETSQWKLLLCLINAFLPPVVENTIQFILSHSNVILIVIDIIRNGITLPGEVILFFFGWADFDDGSLQANTKWNYCVTAVVGFLLGIEILKLVAIRFIVWTKR